MTDWINNYIFWIKFKQKNIVNDIILSSFLNKKEIIRSKPGSDLTIIEIGSNFFFRA